MSPNYHSADFQEIGRKFFNPLNANLVNFSRKNDLNYNSVDYTQTQTDSHAEAFRMHNIPHVIFLLKMTLFTFTLFRLRYTLFDSSVNWCYYTEPQKHLNNRKLYWPRAKVSQFFVNTLQTKSRMSEAILFAV